MNAVVKTWLVLALGIGMAGMASAGEGWVDEPLNWDAKGAPSATVDGAWKTVDGAESVVSVPEEEHVETEAEEGASAGPEPKGPAKKPLWKEGGEKTVKVLGYCVAGTLGIFLRYPEVIRLLIH